MKSGLSIQEKLKDLRTEHHMTLDELAAETGLSRSALGSYESVDYKDISHTAVVILAKYYSVSTDFLLGFTENIAHKDSEIADLHLDDETVKILKSGKINNRLLCEIIKHEDFEKFMSDTEIYIDSLATMQINNLNAYVSIMRSQLQMKRDVPDTEHYIQTLKASEISENDYFSRLIGFDITAIAKDLKEMHKKDKETGEDNSPLSEAIDIIKEYDSTAGAMKTTLSVLSKQLGINFSRMDPYELQSFTTIIEKYSDTYKKFLPKRGKSKR